MCYINKIDINILLALSHLGYFYLLSFVLPLFNQGSPLRTSLFFKGALGHPRGHRHTRSSGQLQCSTRGAGGGFRCLAQGHLICWWGRRRVLRNYSPRPHYFAYRSGFEPATDAPNFNRTLRALLYATFSVFIFPLLWLHHRCAV